MRSPSSGSATPAPSSRTARSNSAPPGAHPAGTALPGAARYGSAMVGSGKRGGPWRVVFWAALAVFLLSIAALGVIAFSYWQGQDKYTSLASEVFAPPADIANADLSDIAIDWDALRAVNPDTVGWVYVPGTRVNYPIVHTTDDEKYLKTDFNGDRGWLASYGAIFLSAANKPDFSDANSIIYGHHMNDGSMFAQFADYREAEVFNRHRTVYLLTPHMNYRLSTFSLVEVLADDPLAQPTFADDAALQAYVEENAARSMVVPDPPAPDSISKVFTFVTCSDYTQTNNRIVLFSSVAASAQPRGTESEGDTGMLPEDKAQAEAAAKEIQ